MMLFEDPSWPPFLDLLDKDPKAAFEGFYRFAVAVLTEKPPRPMFSLDPEDRQDAIHIIVLHCVDRNFRVLRKYRRTGKPFAVWFFAVAHNEIISYIRKLGTEPISTSIPDDSESIAKAFGLFNPGRIFELREVLVIIRKKIEKMGEYCRLLLEMAADEIKPRQMVVLLGLSPDHNKKVSGDLRECRRKLKKRLSDGGIDFASFWGT